MTQNKRIILVGKAGSGKDFMRKRLEESGFRYAVSYTTRPPRDTEVNGSDYFFLSEETATAMIDAGEFFEWVEFNGWIYGTTIKQWHEDTVFIMTPTGISHIGPDDRRSCFIIFIDIDIETRRDRLAARCMPGDSLERRLEADETDFLGFTNYDIRITNPDF